MVPSWKNTALKGSVYSAIGLLMTGTAAYIGERSETGDTIGAFESPGQGMNGPGFTETDVGHGTMQCNGT